MNRLRGSLFGVLASLAWLVAAADAPLTIVELHHRTAEQVLPVLRPFVAQGGTLSGAGNQLFIRTTAQNLAELRRLLGAIDRAPRQLLITVRQGAAAQQAERSLEAGGAISGGAGTGEANARLRIYRTEGANEERDTQQVRATEGMPAQIRIGLEVPVGSRSLVPTPLGDQATDTIVYRNLVTAIAVVAHLSGDRVTLDLDTRREAPSDAGGGRFDTRQVHTTVSGRLGQWLEIGGVGTAEINEENGILYRRTRKALTSGPVLIKVEEIH